MKTSALIALLLGSLALLFWFSPAGAAALQAGPLCGNGSAPDYGFTYDLLQPHWTLDWQGYVSETTVDEVDAILDRLDSDAILQTMILFKPQDQVGNRVNCAVHFLRYMKLGLPSGERKDNGFTFLIVVEPNRIDVHYGVGLGLPALTAPGLTALNRAAEETYQSTHSMDQALLALVRGLDAYARSKYPPLEYTPGATPTPAGPPAPAGPLDILTNCGLLCLGALILIFLLWLFIQLARAGIVFTGSPGSGSSWSGFPSGGGSRPSGGGAPRMRGGGGSGRSGRGN